MFLEIVHKEMQSTGMMKHAQPITVLQDVVLDTTSQ